MTEEFLVGSCSLTVVQEHHFIRVNKGQCVIRLQFADRGILLATLILGPELRIAGSAIGGKGYAHFTHALHQAAAADSLVVRMGHHDKGVFQQRSQRSHYQSRMADSMYGFAPPA